MKIKERSCPNCKSDNVEFFCLVDKGYGWYISADDWNFIPAKYCPDCGHELPYIMRNKKMNNLSMIGWKVTLKVPMLGNPFGAVGYVFNQYEDFDDSDAIGLQIIFPNGEYDGFSVDEQNEFLELLHPVMDYIGYEFQNVMQVSSDYKSGYWSF